MAGNDEVAEVLERVGGRVPVEEAFYAVEQLFASGYAVDQRGQGHSECAQSALWRALDLPWPPTGVASALYVHLLSLDGADPQPLHSSLTLAGFEVERGNRLASASLNVVVVDDYLTPALEQINRNALDDTLRWVPVKLSGVVPWIGPLFTPDSGACWQCLAHRLRCNRPVETYLARKLGTGAPVLPKVVRSTLGATAAASLATVLLAEALTVPQSQTPLGRHLLTFDLKNKALTHHPVTQRPTCRECGKPLTSDRAANEPLRLRSRVKRYTAEGGHRVLPPEETFRRHEHLISPVTGIISSLGRLEHRSHSLRPVYGVTWFATPAEDRISAGDFHRTGLGKGRTESQAKASALGEAIERWAAAFQGDESTHRACFSEVERDAIHPDALLLLSEAQRASARNASSSPIARPLRVPPPLRDDQPIDWCAAWSLTHDQQRLLPLAFCYADVPGPDEERICYYDSNGDAAGNCLEEAILQGFLELVERDAVAIWWYNELARPGVDLTSFEDQYLVDLLDHYASMGYRLWALDLTTDLQICTFCAYAEEAEGHHFSIGFGCHWDPKLALQRAVTELNQLFDPTRQQPLPWRLEDLNSPAFLRPDPALAPRTAQDWDGTSSSDLRDDVLRCVARAERAGLETLVHRRWRPDVELSTVKVVAPGLRHFWPRYAPGRLYDVPVHLGWRARPRAEHELNPVPLLL